MDCRRTIRELLDFFRFGELDARSTRHLEHLEVCPACRQAVGLDRELVLQLQRALRARVDGHAASPGAWIEIRRRAQEREPSFWRSLLPLHRLAPVGVAAVLLLATLVPLSGLSLADQARPERGPATPSNVLITADGDPVDRDPGRWWQISSTPLSPGPQSGAMMAIEPHAAPAARPAPASGITR